MSYEILEKDQVLRKSLQPQRSSKAASKVSGGKVKLSSRRLKKNIPYQRTSRTRSLPKQDHTNRALKAIRALNLQCQRSLALSGIKDHNARQHQGGLLTPGVAKLKILNMRGYLWGIGES